MGFEITKEQKMIQKMAREFSRKELAKTAAERDITHEYPAENLKKMGELGLLGMLVSEKYGGEDMGTVAYSLALSEVAYSCASTAVIMSVHNSICCGSIEKFGSEEAAAGYCLYKVGCRGPETYNNCPIAKFNDGTSWPVEAGAPCIGCSEPAFWDKFTPFYEEL